MKKETAISILVCAVFLALSGWLYLRSEGRSEETGQGWQLSAAVSVPPEQAGRDVSAGAQGTAGEDMPAGTEAPAQECVVYICGAVRHPGVYPFSAGARVCDAVEAAGGFTGKAVLDAINQARYLTDGEQITVPARTRGKENDPGGGQGDPLEGTEESYAAEQGSAAEGLVNINQADVSELMTLSGIGEARAQMIVEYRKENGGFQTTGDIMKVSGIKEGIYDQIKDRITV